MEDSSIVISNAGQVRLDVVNVGDGACSILDDGQTAMALDCGSWRSPKGIAESRLLVATLGARQARMQALAVSHFDRDHWMGLHALASTADLSMVPEEITIFFPGLPALAAKLVAAYLTVQARSGRVSVRALDMKAAWESAGRTVHLEPLFAGDKLTIGSQSYDVLWPPAELDPAWSKAARNALSELNQLAPQVPGLVEELEEAYGDLWINSGQEQALARAEARAPQEVGPPVGEQQDAQHPFEFELGDQHEQDERPGPEELFDEFEHPDLPPEVLAALKSLADRLAALNNPLSLVFESAPFLTGPGGERFSWLLAMGDVQGWALRRLTASLGDHYCVALAPHHGTVTFPRAPRTGICVLQQGREHQQRADRHVESHRCDAISTYDLGADGLLFREGQCYPGVPLGWRREWGRTRTP